MANYAWNNFYGANTFVLFQKKLKLKFSYDE